MTVQITRITTGVDALPVQMNSSDATAERLVKRGPFAADQIRFPPGGQVEAHTHPGDHILVCLSGSGTLWYAGERHDLVEGVVYMVPGSTPHAIYADRGETLSLLSVANDHRDAGSPERLDLL